LRYVAVSDATIGYVLVAAFKPDGDANGGV
jgi:hypothetical protein